MTIEVFGITGTNGKTTVSYMLRNILETDGKACGLIGTIGHRVGEEVYEPQNTTPGADTLQDLFHKMKLKGIRHCVMEASSHGIAQGRMANLRIAYGGFTNLSRDHLDYHKTMENYYQVKKQFFRQCEKAALINVEDPYGRRLYEELKKENLPLKVQSSSLKRAACDFFGQVEWERMEGTKVKIYVRGEFLGKVKIPMAGRHFAQNGLQAIGLALQSGVKFPAVKTGMETLPQIPGRMELLGSEDETLGIVDYAHTPDGLEHLLRTAALHKKGRLICVFGCGGFRDKEKRSMMGKIAGTYADYCIVTNDNPRGEPPENIAGAIEEGLYPTGCDYCILLDRRQAIEKAVLLSTKWDIIVVAGKGHEKYQLTGDKKIPFDDSLYLRKQLEQKI